MNFKIQKPEKLIKALIHNVQGMSFGSAQKSIRLGKVKVNNKRTKDNIDVKVGDIVEIYEFKKSKPTTTILYEDDNILIINKPYGIECATRDKSSANTYSLEELFEEHNAIVVHRLDRLTEGLVILAKSKDIAIKFEKIFRTREINKFYKACVYGEFNDIGIKKAYLKKNPNTALVEICDSSKEDFKEIITEIALINNTQEYSILDIKLHTGRTHQIRAHLSYLGHPILGDTKYANNKAVPISTIDTKQYNGYYLTAYKIDFKITDKDLKYLNDLHIEIEPTWVNTLNYVPTNKTNSYSIT